MRGSILSAIRGIRLPWTSRRSERNRDFVSVRMEAIGGQGANSAGKILAEAAALEMGLQASHFSSYGSEKQIGRAHV